MSATLIINARHRLAWHRRLASDASTAMMWAVWLWLWSPLLQSMRGALHLGARSLPTLTHLAASFSGRDLKLSLAALIGTSGSLLVWSRFPAVVHSRAAEPLTVRDSARYHRLPEHELREGLTAPVCVVHHDEAGRIVRIEAREPLGALRALAG